MQTVELIDLVICTQNAYIGKYYAFVHFGLITFKYVKLENNNNITDC
jgi:hypothetical protein